MSKAFLASFATNIHILPVAATPGFSPNPYTYNTAQSVTLTDASSGVTMYYTTDGSTPTTNSTRYTVPILVPATTQIKAIAVGTNYRGSAVASGTYKITAAAPSLSPNPYTYNTPQTVTLTDISTGATIYYTTDGSTPTAASTKYATPIAVSTTGTIKAIAIGGGYGASAVTTGTYKITAAAPTLSPNPYTYKTAQSVTSTDVSTGTTIYYTTNGSTPTAASTAYTTPTAVPVTTTIKAIAVGGNYGTSTGGRYADLRVWRGAYQHGPFR